MTDITKEKLYAGVIVDLRVDAVDKVFQYGIPDNMTHLDIGHRVLVPFGSRRIEGYVINKSPHLTIDPSRVRNILRILDPEPIILPSLVELGIWMSKHYVGLLSEALQFMLPPGYRYGRERVGAKTQQVVRLLESDPTLPRNAAAQKRVVNVLKEHKTLLASELVRLAQTSHSTLRRLEQKGILMIENEKIERPIDWDVIPCQSFVLSPEQENACRVIAQESSSTRKPVLIHGVTGSGKTEVYLQAIKETLAQGKRSIVLVPEIALTPQTVSRFGSRFGDRISVFHSGLSEGERFDQWWRIFRGEVDVVIGARSAVFAPVQNLGLIVIDEEHEGTYKQEEGSIRYHTRTVAEKRAELVGATVVLGSATPSVESYHEAVQGRYRLVEMRNRVENRPLPSVEIVDMRQEFEKKNRSMFSESLATALRDLVEHEEQAIILINRRGFASFVLCRECGYVLQCPNCQVSLTYHKADGKLHCHYCPHREDLPLTCPKCASRYLRQFGVGTEQVQAQIQKEFPQIRSLRLDADTTRRKGAHRRILGQFRSGEAHVLIGTQMVAKGHDFPNVTLVGVLSADLSLNFPDIRASERTFQLLTQVAGRCGRGDKPGHVIIQCYEPSHFAIQSVRSHDYASFYRQEISFRRMLQYPPFRCLTRILCSGPEEMVRDFSSVIYGFLLDKGIPKKDILGPSAAPIGKIKGRYRWQLIVKSDKVLSDILQELPPAPGDVYVSVDIDPLFLL